MINRHYLFFYFFIYVLLCKVFFTNIRYFKNDKKLKNRRNFENDLWNNLNIIKNYYKRRFLQETKNNILHLKKHIKENHESQINILQWENKSNKENIYKRNEKDNIRLKKLIISFKDHNNFLSLRIFKNKFIHILSYCGNVKKLDYINFYLYDFFKELSETHLKTCLHILKSKMINIEMDYKIKNIEVKTINTSEKIMNEPFYSHSKKLCDMFKLNNNSNFKFFLNKKCNMTNILDGYDVIQVKEAIALARPYELNDVNVCIVDTGIDHNHDDLKENIIEIKKIKRNMEKSDTSSSDIDSSMDKHGHGTFIAGIIAGNSQNNKGIKGISKKAKLIICKALNDNNTGYISDILECFNFCAKKKAKIINASFASTTNHLSLFNALMKLQEKNILVITSSGNCSVSKSKNSFQQCNLDIKKLYPSAYSSELNNLISVSNMLQHPNGNIILSPDSCYSNNYVHLAAPGRNIRSTLPYNKYAVSSGSSFSAAIITGFASLVLSINSELTYIEVIEKFKNSIIPSKSFKNKVKWGGFINAYNLIKSTTESLKQN
ncbi:subtilisin-like protease 3, putative [Plasmodium gallinaceum]|uniref:subtilisin n=1 Tax=Plasmodium gallinaceum TaxID=5849 RepID=A0A1J1GZX8_PLAGA|nr:subtilisin-like protease 3, putative [Plasmodium gallinaceum]CRG97848.1 subtilisin-like protease 3, putative [Plasmodium gallinaceum]